MCFSYSYIHVFIYVGIYGSFGDFGTDTRLARSLVSHILFYGYIYSGVLIPRLAITPIKYFILDLGSSYSILRTKAGH
jgi:hypothetical protein